MKAELPLIVVTGASGYLGQTLVPWLAARARVVAVYRNQPPASSDATPLQLDLSDRAATLSAFRHLQPDAVIHAAAANPGAPLDELQSTNVGAATNVAQACSDLGAGCRLVHVSTDVLHDGHRAPYADDASPSPISAYGRTKAVGEATVLELCPTAVAVRTSLIYGLIAVDRGTQGFIERLARAETVRLFADVIRQPVWVDALSESLARLALDDELRQVSGSLNVAGSQALSRAEFGRRLLEWWKVPIGEHVQDISAADFPEVNLDLRLTLERARSLGLPLNGFDEVLPPSGHPGHRR